MLYMVIFRSPEGKPGYRQAEAITDAITIVERLRNEENAEGVRIYRMEEVAFEFKVRYEVELADELVAAEAESEQESRQDDAGVPTLSSTPLFDQQRAAINPERAPAWVEENSGEADDEEEPETLMAENDNPPRKGLFGR